MAPTEGRVAKPERRWGCRRGTRSAMYLMRCQHSCQISIPVCADCQCKPARSQSCSKPRTLQDASLLWCHVIKSMQVITV